MYRARQHYRFAGGLAVTDVCMLHVAAPARAQLRPTPEALTSVSPELLDRLRSDPFTYFRFINRPWTARVCEAFNNRKDVPFVRLHGDAHVEQYAVTSNAWGLDDFDDSARGPALVDLVRFLGSIDLVLRQRGWIANRQALFDWFLEGYRKGLAEPDSPSPRPDIVGRLRRKASRSRAEFLAWGETLMAPMDDASTRGVVAAMDAIAPYVYAERPDLARGYLSVVHAGWLHVGIGSAITQKILIRIQ